MLIRADRMGQVLWCVGLVFAFVACGEDPPDSDEGTGGVSMVTGGVTTSGGTPQTGGTTVSGGTEQTGGTTVAGGTEQTGGTTETGGAAETGGTTANHFAGDNEVAAGAVCDRLSTLQCAGEEKCCDSPGRTFEECKATVLEECTNDVFFDTVTGNAITGFNGARAKSVLDEFESISKSCDTTVASWGASNDGLWSMMEGTLAEGASCKPSLATTSPRKDAAAALVACATPATISCLPKGVIGSWTCTPRGDVGAECFTDANCVAGLYCPQDDYLDPDFGQECAARLEDEESCDSNNECVSLACKDDVCVEATTQSAYCIL